MHDLFRKIAIARLDVTLFGVYLLLMPFSWRKVVTMNNGHTETFNEYLSFFIYAQDFIFIFLLMISILNIYYIKKSIDVKKMFHVEQKTLMILGIFLLWSILSIIWSENRLLAMYTNIRLIEGIGLLVYVGYFFVPRGTETQERTSFLKYIITILIGSAIFQTLIGFAQFIKGSSLGLHWLGESILSLGGAGVAKIYLIDNLFLRAYGTFPHPNVLGGFLLIVIFLLIFAQRRKLFHVERNFYYLMLYFLATGILLTFSKNALTAVILSLIWLHWIDWRKSLKTVPRGTNRLSIAKSLFHVEHIKLTLFLTIGLLMILFLQNRYYLEQSLNERLELLPYSAEMNQSYPLKGVGSGQFVDKLTKRVDIETWKYQPIHNLYLLIKTELGLIGILLFLAFLWSLLRKVPRGTEKAPLYVTCIGLIIVGLSDHYLWDIEEGRTMFWLTAGFLINMLNVDKN